MLRVYENGPGLSNRTRRRRLVHRPLPGRGESVTGRRIGQRAIDDFGDLAARGLGAGPVVGPVLRVAPLAWPAAAVAADDAPAGRRLHEQVERAGGRHVG